MRTAKLFFALVLFVFGLSFFGPVQSSAQSFQNPLLLVPFDFNYYDYSSNKLYSGWFTGGAPADIDLGIKKFGPASGHFPATGIDREMLYKSPNFDLSGQDFTIDFWWYPTTQDMSSFNKILLSFYDLDGNGIIKSLKWYLKYDGRAPYAGFQVVDGPKNEELRWISSDGILNINQWNHISVQWKQGNGGYDGGNGLGISINGKMRPSNSFYNNGPIPSAAGAMIVGFSATNFPRVDYYMDELRITKGTALWGSVSNQNGSFTPPTQPTRGDFSNPVVEQNRVATPPAQDISTHIVSLGNTPDSAQSSLAYPACPPGSSRPSVREEYLIKLDGTPKLTSYFDVNNKLICTSYWAGNATTTESKKIKRFEYDGDGQISREIYYGIDGASITDVVVYYPKSVGGARQKEVQNRNGTEYYKRYSTTGRLLYEHEYKNGQYVVSRNFTYDGAGRLSNELVFYSPSKYEKVVYARNSSGVVTQTDSYRAYAPIGTDTAKYVHTTSTYKVEPEGYIETGTVVTGIIRTYFNKDAGAPTALRTEIAEYSTSGVAIKQRTFDYAQKKQKFSTYITTTGSKSLGRLKTDEEWSLEDYSYASSSLAYDMTTGDLISWKKTDYDDMSAQGGTAGYYSTKYTTYNPKTGLVKKEDAYQYWPSLNWKKTDSVSYDDKGVVVARHINEARDSSSVNAHTVTKYSPEGLIQSVAKYDEVTGIAIRAESYYGNGEVWYLQKYQYNTSTQQYTVTSSRVNYRNSLSTSTPSDLVADGSKVYTKNFVFVSEPAKSDPIGQKKIGDKILANISDASLRSQAQTGAEKVAIVAVLKAILPEYKNALLTVSESDPLKKAKRYEIYVAYSWKITRAIYAIEYRFYSGSPKYLNTDKALEDTVTGWYGIDGADLSGNTEFWGLYTRPGAVGYADAEAAYIDMSILNPSAVDVTINATSYNTLTSNPKKIEKWDALRTGTGFSYFNNTLSLFNLSGGVGRFITLDEMTKADPTINLTLNRFEEDMKNAGVVLSNLSETQLIEKMYEYFNKQSYFSYLYDLSQVAQTVNQTLVRKGGDCEDFGLFFLSLLRGEFTRLGNMDAVGRLGLVTARVDGNNPVTVQNAGSGHATVGFRQGSTYYYIEASYLFLGSGADVARPVPRALNPLSTSGSTVAGTLGQGGWYVQVSDMYPVLGSKVSFSGSLGTFHDTTGQTNSVDTTVARVSNINTYLEPYDPVVTTLASSTVQTIPSFKNQSVNFVVESTHNFFNRLAQYVPDTGADVWKKVTETIPPVINPDGTVNLSAKISGDCEDLAFAEASLLENVLLRYYIAGGALPDNAVNQAKTNVIVVAEKNYGSPTGPSHLYVGYLIPKTNTSPAVVRLIDPQSGNIGAPQLMSDLYNDKYLFFADREKVSAITPYDWSLFNLSAAIKAAAAEGVVLNPNPVDPKAPTTQNLTETQQAAIINAMVPEPPPQTLFEMFVSWAYKASKLQAVVEATSKAEKAIRVAVAAALAVGGGPVATAVEAGIAVINSAAEAMTGEPIIITSGDAGVAVGNAVIAIVTSLGGPKSQELAAAEAAYARGNTAPAPTGTPDPHLAIVMRDVGVVFVQRKSTHSVVHAISSHETSRTTETRSYNSNTNVMTVTTHTTIVIHLGPRPFAPITYGYYQPPRVCVPGVPAIPLCSTISGEITTAPANAKLNTPSTCYVSDTYPSCETRQYNTTWSCNAPYYAMTTASATECTCVDLTASNYGSVATCRYGATISCVGGSTPPANSVSGSTFYPAPAGQTSSSTIPWSYNASAVTGSTGCIWSCASGFVKSGAECIPDQVFTCPALTGVSVEDADRILMCADDETGLRAATTSILRSNSFGCTTPKKCEFTCIKGFDKGIGNTCVCSTTPVGGVCGGGPVVSSQVTLKAFPPASTGSGYSLTPSNDRITVRKAQAFMLEWEQSNSSIVDGIDNFCYSDVSKVGNPSWEEPLPPTGMNKWESGRLDLEGSVPKLSLSEAGSYVYTVICQYGSGVSRQVSLPSSIIVNVAPSGVFEEF